MFCPHCGATLPEGSMFCAQCGQRVTAVPPVQPTPVPAAKKPAGNLFRILLGVLYLLLTLAFMDPISSPQEMPNGSNMPLADS